MDRTGPVPPVLTSKLAESALLRGGQVLADRTMWRVRWRLSGACGTYFVGSCGRYHLQVHALRHGGGAGPHFGDACSAL